MVSLVSQALFWLLSSLSKKNIGGVRTTHSHQQESTEFAERIRQVAGIRKMGIFLVGAEENGNCLASIFQHATGIPWRIMRHTVTSNKRSIKQYGKTEVKNLTNVTSMSMLRLNPRHL